jgi:hypothetical protein
MGEQSATQWELVTHSGSATVGLRHFVCGRTSWNRHDVEHRYCGHCHVYLDDPPGSVVSQRRSPEIKSLWAVVVRQADGFEGVVRRDTPSGTQPWITDDASLAAVFLEFVRRESGVGVFYLVRFDRAVTTEGS